MRLAWILVMVAFGLEGLTPIASAWPWMSGTHGDHEHASNAWEDDRVPDEQVADLDQENEDEEVAENEEGDTVGESKAQAVDLGSLSRRRRRRRSKRKETFRAYFDLALYSFPDIQPLTFGNFHSFVFLDIVRSQDVSFQFDLASNAQVAGFPSPSYYQFDWQATSWFKVSAGKIWIPFDDMSPHAIFGGRVNVNLLRPSADRQFLPTLWTDFGVNLKWTPLDLENFRLDFDTYVVNGFQDGGVDPLGGGDYPSFADIGMAVRDNNTDKGVGVRGNMLIASKFNIGGSFYTNRWNDEDQAEKHRLFAYGFHSFLKLKVAEARVGAMVMQVQIPGDTILRGGYYGEIGVPIYDFKLIARGGSVQLDDRVRDPSDQTIIGGVLQYSLPTVRFSFEYSHDLVDRPGKLVEDFLALRAVFRI
jgi:hypothetical protein